MAEPAPASSPFQTARRIKQLLRSHGLRPNRSLGQCFLIDRRTMEAIVELAALERTDLVLEVGTGTGSLTGLIAQRAGAVVSVEVDRALYGIARELLGDEPNVVLLCCDALRTKHQVEPAVLAAVEEAQRSFGCQRRKLVANLPYRIATPLLINLLYSGPRWERFVVTVQLELAQKMVARPGEDAYGAVSVLMQAVAEVRLERRVPPAAFWPRPEVYSAVVDVVPDAERYQAVRDLAQFRRFVHRLFAARRRTLAKALQGVAPTARAEQWLKAAGVDPRRRVERLGWQEFVWLFGTLENN